MTPADPRPLRVAMVPGVGVYPNPYLARLAAHLELLEIETVDVDVVLSPAGPPDVDVIHVHWPEQLLGGRRAGAVNLWRLARAIRSCQRGGGAVVWTLHNVEPHEPRAFAWAAWRLLARSADAIVSFSEHALDRLGQVHPVRATTKRRVIGHGELRGVHGEPVTRQRARQELGLDPTDRVAVFLGQVRDYKGVPELVETVRAIDDGNLRLIVAGRVATVRLRHELEQAASGDSRIEIVDDFLDDASMARYLGAADLVVLPYRQVTHSGSVLLALSHDVPVLATAVGALPEWQAELGAGWLWLCQDTVDADSFRTALDAGIELRDATWPVPAGQHWDTIATRLADLYRELVAG